MSPEFKGRVAMEALSGRKTLQEIAADHAIHPIQVSQWKQQLLEGASELFTRSKQTKGNDEGQAKEAELFQQIGRLQMELEWLKKVSTALMPMNDASWSITTTLNSAAAVTGCETSGAAWANERSTRGRAPRCRASQPRGFLALSI
jgi:transposase-like protein